MRLCGECQSFSRLKPMDALAFSSRFMMTSSIIVSLGIFLPGKAGSIVNEIRCKRSRVELIKTPCTRQDNVKTVHCHAYLHALLKCRVAAVPRLDQEFLAQAGRVIPLERRADVKRRVIQRHGIEVDQVQRSLL